MQRELFLVLVAALNLCARSADAEVSPNQSDDASVSPQNASPEPPARPATYGLQPDQAVDYEVRALLKNKQYRFCQDPNFRLFEEEKVALCSQLDAFEGRCPELKAACARPPWEADLDKVQEEDSFNWDFLNLSGDLVAALFKLLFWAALGIGAFYLLRALLRQARQWRDEYALQPSVLPAAPTTDMPNDHEELRVAVLLSMAQSELEKNRVTASLHLTYQATIRALSDATWVKPHKSKTSGDYLAALRKLNRRGAQRNEENPERGGALNDAKFTNVNAAQTQFRPDAPPVQEVTAHLIALDRERFRSTPRSDQAHDLLARARALVARLLHVGAFILLLGSSGCDTPSRPQSPDEPTASRGTQLFEDLIKSRAERVTRRMHPVVDLAPETVTVISMAAVLKELEWTTLENWASDGGHLIVIAPDSTFPEVFGLDSQVANCSAPLLAPELSAIRTGETLAFSGTIYGEVLARCGDRQLAVSQKWGAGRLTVVADAQLFKNAGLAAGDNATLALYIIGDLDGPVEYLGPWTGSGAHHPLQSITRAGFGWWVLHILVLGLVYAWSYGAHFGTPRDPAEIRRRDFAEHARALSRKYQKAQASGFALQNYAEWVYDNLRRRAPSTRSDMKSLTRAVSSSDKEAGRLREALTSARRADELGDDAAEHRATFLRLKSAMIGLSEQSQARTQKKE